MQSPTGGSRSRRPPPRSTSGRSLRPLEAPHRTGLPPAAPLFDDRDPNSLVRRLRQLLPATPAPVGVLGRHVHRPADPLAPRPRRRRDLPSDWRDYLATGATPELGGSDHSRSTYELIATTALLQAGHTADSAWALIAAAHPSAMTKTRSRGRAWWTRWVWNPAVWRDLQTAPTVSPAQADTPVSATIRATRELLWTLLPGQARRTSVLRVGLAILERMERTGTLRVPVAERDLLLDTGIKDRKTIRAALRLLDDHGVGTLHTTTSDRLAAFEFSLPPDRTTQNPPPSNHYPPPPPALWHLLPPGAPVLHTHLRTSSAPLSPTALLRAAGYTSPGAGPTSRQTARRPRGSPGTRPPGTRLVRRRRQLGRAASRGDRHDLARDPGGGPGYACSSHRGRRARTAELQGEDLDVVAPAACRGSSAPT